MDGFFWFVLGFVIANLGWGIFNVMSVPRSIARAEYEAKIWRNSLGDK